MGPHFCRRGLTNGFSASEITNEYEYILWIIDNPGCFKNISISFEPKDRNQEFSRKNLASGICSIAFILDFIFIKETKLIDIKTDKEKG